MVLFFNFIFLVPFVCANAHNSAKKREFLQLQPAAVAKWNVSQDSEDTKLKILCLTNRLQLILMQSI